MIYAEWLLNGKIHIDWFNSWQDFNAATFNPDIELKRLDVKIGKKWFSKEF